MSSGHAMRRMSPPMFTPALRWYARARITGQFYLTVPTALLWCPDAAWGLIVCSCDLVFVSHEARFQRVALFGYSRCCVMCVDA